MITIIAIKQLTVSNNSFLCPINYHWQCIDVFLIASIHPWRAECRLFCDQTSCAQACATASELECPSALPRLQIPGASGWGRAWSLFWAKVSDRNKQAFVSPPPSLVRTATLWVQLLLWVLIRLLNSWQACTVSTLGHIVWCKDKCGSCA